jgi:hypothetical protein
MIGVGQAAMKAVKINSKEPMLENSVLDTIRYYAFFDYPVSASEILSSLSLKSSLDEVKETLLMLESQTRVFEHNGFYSVVPGIRMLSLKREYANRLAEARIAEAIKTGKRINNFPFVKFVSISGSLSKGYADRKTDFDFFILTAKNRLWICRTILHLYKKLTFLSGRQHRYCMNYFIDESHPEIEDKNRYTAIELASIIPVAGGESYEKLKNANAWIKNFLPNGYQPFYRPVQPLKDEHRWYKSLAEKVLDIAFPEKLNSWLMRFTDKRWRDKWERRNYPMDEYDTAFKTNLHISKNHPANFQKKILEAISTF